MSQPHEHLHEPAQRQPRDLGGLRREYGDAGLDVGDLEDDPVAMFEHWMDDAVEAGLHEPNAMVLATVSEQGRPSSRVVLLKGLDERGFVFYTNYESRKSREITAHPAVSLLFDWHDVQRQVRVEGTAQRVSAEETAAYFARRPRASQLGAWASPQSQVVGSRAALDERYGGVLARFADAEEVPVPRSGAASGWRRRRWSSGRDAVGGCTTGCATGGRSRTRTRRGPWSASRPEAPGRACSGGGDRRDGGAVGDGQGEGVARGPRRHRVDGAHPQPCWSPTPQPAWGTASVTAS